MTRCYLSNARPAWPIEWQEAILDKEAPGWRKQAVYRDELSARKRKTAKPEDLPARSDMLRPTSRRQANTVCVACLPPLALSLADFLSVLAALAERGDTLTALKEGVTVPPDAGAVEIGKASEAFVAAVRRGTSEGGPGKGGRISAERREAAAKARCELIRERWRLPSDRHPTLALLAEADVSRATAKKHLGKRHIAQEKYSLGQQQAERNRKRRKNDVEA